MGLSHGCNVWLIGSLSSARYWPSCVQDSGEARRYRRGPGARPVFRESALVSLDRRETSYHRQCEPGNLQDYRTENSILFARRPILSRMERYSTCPPLTLIVGSSRLTAGQRRDPRVRCSIRLRTFVPVCRSSCAWYPKETSWSGSCGYMSRLHIGRIDRSLSWAMLVILRYHIWLRGQRRRSKTLLYLVLYSARYRN